jgi:hypothetical protein
MLNHYRRQYTGARLRAFQDLQAFEAWVSSLKGPLIHLLSND